MVLLEAKAEACEAQSHSPTLDREQALIERADDVGELGVLDLQVIVEAVEGIGCWFRRPGRSHGFKVLTALHA